MSIFTASARPLRTAAAAIAFCVAANAQTISTFTQEITVLPTALSAATPPPIPPSLIAAIASGALEIRQQAIDANLKQLRVKTFTVAPSRRIRHLPPAKITSWTITPSMSRRPFSDIASEYGVDRIRQQCCHPSPIGVVRGSIVIYSVGYTQGVNGAAQFNNTTVVLPGTGRFLLAATSSGTLRFAGDATPATGGTGTGAPVADAGPDITALTLEAQLDGSKSSDPDGDAITYSWKSVGRSASLRNATSAMPIVQFGEGFGEYEFELTVTDSKGLSTTDRVKVLYLARFD